MTRKSPAMPMQGSTAWARRSSGSSGVSIRSAGPEPLIHAVGVVGHPVAECLLRQRAGGKRQDRIGGFTLHDVQLEPVESEDKAKGHEGGPLIAVHEGMVAADA